jgi:hypothetical protein
LKHFLVPLPTSVKTSYEFFNIFGVLEFGEDFDLFDFFR